MELWSQSLMQRKLLLILNTLISYRSEYSHYHLPKPLISLILNVFLAFKVHKLISSIFSSLSQVSTNFAFSSILNQTTFFFTLITSKTGSEDAI